MIRVLILLGTLVFGLIYGPQVSENKGYLLLSFDSYTTYETTLINAGIIAVLFYFTLLLVEWILRKLLSMSSVTRNWFGIRKTRQAQKNSLLGMLALFEGDTKQAQKLLAKSAARSETPVLNYIAAGKAAHAEGKYDLRDDYFLKANECGESSMLAVGLIWAELQIDAKQVENALATLTELKKNNPNNKAISLLLLELYPHLENWKKYIYLLDAQSKNLGKNEKEIAKLRLNAHVHLFQQLASEGGISLKSWWDDKAPRWMKKELSYQKALLDAYLNENCGQQAEQFLIEKLNKQFSLPLLPYLKKVQLIDYHPLITFLEKKLKRESEKGLIHQALAYLMLKENKADAAIEHLTISLKTDPCVDDYAQLGTLLEKSGKLQEAQIIFREGLLFADKQ